MPMRIAMMPMTTRSSISEKPTVSVARIFFSCTTSSNSISPIRALRRWHGFRWLDLLRAGHVVQFGQVPDLDRVIATSRDQAAAIGGERNAGDDTGMAAEGAKRRAGAAVPDLHRAVLARRGEPPAVVVGAEGDGVDVTAVFVEGVQLALALHVPDLDSVLLAPRRQAPAVRAERHVQIRPGNVRAVGELADGLLLVQTGRVPQV